MARPVRPWFRVYVETFMDRKIRRLKPAERWLWIAVLGAARQSPEPGQLLVAPGLPMTVEELADYASVPLRDARSGVATMTTLSMLTCTDGVMSVTNWDARQFESDNVTDRTRGHRERSREQPRNVPKNVPGNPPDTETDTETEVTTCASATAERDAIDHDFAEWYAIYPRKKGKGQAIKAYRAARKKADAATLINGLRAALPGLRARPIDKVNYPASWLNGEFWLDEDDAPDNVHHLPTSKDDPSIPEGAFLLPPLPSRSPFGPTA